MKNAHSFFFSLLILLPGLSPSVLGVEGGLFRVWRGSNWSEIHEERFRPQTNEGQIVEIEMSVAGVDAPVATQECGAAFVFLHGPEVSLSSYRVISERLRRLPVKQYFFSFDSRTRSISLSAEELASQILRLRSAQLDRSCRVVLIAHGTSGWVARGALNVLASHPESEIGKVVLVSVETPWHAFSGAGWRFSRWLGSAGMADLMSGSWFLQQVYARTLPSHLSTRILFAKGGGEVMDFTEFPISAVTELIAREFSPYLFPERDSRVFTRPVELFFQSLRQSEGYSEMLQSYQQQRAHSSRALIDWLNTHMELFFPRFSGSHTGVLDREWELAEYLDQYLTRMIEFDVGSS